MDDWSPASSVPYMQYITTEYTVWQDYISSANYKYYIRPVFDCATYSHVGDCLDQWHVGITVSNIVAYINECLEKFGRKQSSKLSPVSLCTIQIPEMVREEQVSRIKHQNPMCYIIITTSVLSKHFSAVLLTIFFLHFLQERSVWPVSTHHFPVSVYDGCVVKLGWHARTVR